MDGGRRKEGRFIAHEGIKRSQNRHPRPLHPLPRTGGDTRDQGVVQQKKGAFFFYKANEKG